MLVRIPNRAGDTVWEWSYRLYAVARANENSATLAPVSVGGWSGEGGGTIQVSAKSEVEYRADEGAPYNEERYGRVSISKSPFAARHSKPTTDATDATNESDDGDNAPTSTGEVETTTVAESHNDERKEEAMVAATTKTTKVAGVPVGKVTKGSVKPRVAKASPQVTIPESEVSTAPSTEKPPRKVFRTGTKTGAEITQPSQTLSARAGGPAKSGGGRKPRAAGAAATAPAAAEEANPYPFTLSQVAEATGLNANRVNQYRRAGLLPKRGAFETQGRAVMYSQRAVDAIAKLEEKGTRIPAPQRATAVAGAGNGGAKRRGRPAKAGAANAGGGGGALAAAIQEAEQKAAYYTQRAERLRELANEEA
jgi:hypothetical protein